MESPDDTAVQYCSIHNFDACQRNGQRLRISRRQYFTGCRACRSTALDLSRSAVLPQRLWILALASLNNTSKHPAVVQGNLQTTVLINCLERPEKAHYAHAF